MPLQPVSPVLQLTLPFESAPPPEELFARVYRRLRPSARPARFSVTFRSWAHPRSTIRQRDGMYTIEIFDVLSDAPPIVIEALAEILIMGYHRKRASPEARACYLAHTMAPAVRQRIHEACRVRGFKRIRPARGRYYDLGAIFDELNRTHFAGALRVRKIGWSPRAASTILGHHDAAHETITINRRLDRAKVPRLVVESVVYHEMLHIVFPIERRHHRRVIHSAKFREQERKFPGYREAEQFLKSAGWATD
ncbi:MAG: SprT-like domain-containing protein [Terriglobia bacterium]